MAKTIRSAMSFGRPMRPGYNFKELRIICYSRRNDFPVQSFIFIFISFINIFSLSVFILGRW